MTVSKVKMYIFYDVTIQLLSIASGKTLAYGYSEDRGSILLRVENWKQPTYLSKRKWLNKRIVLCGMLCSS